MSLAPPLIHIAFMLMRPQLWGALEMLVRAAIGDPDVVPYLILAEDTSTYEQHDLSAILRLVADLPIAVHDDTWLRHHLGWFDLAVFHDPYITQWGERTGLDLDTFRAAGVQVALSPYALALHGHPGITRSMFDLPLHHQAWRIYAPSLGQVERFRQFSPRDTDNAVFLGNVKQERLLASASVASAARDLQARLGEGRIVLWNPHFAGEEGGFTFPTFAPVLLERAARSTDEILIIRPIPDCCPTSSPPAAGRRSTSSARCAPPDRTSTSTNHPMPRRRCLPPMSWSRT